MSDKNVRSTQARRMSDKNVRPTRKNRARWVVVSGPVGKQHCKRAVYQAAELLAIDFSGGEFRSAASPILAYCRIQGCWSEFSSGSKRLGRSGSSTRGGLRLRIFTPVGRRRGTTELYKISSVRWNTVDSVGKPNFSRRLAVLFAAAPEAIQSSNPPQPNLVV